MDDVLSITTTGAEIAATATASSVALPTVSGAVPKACRIAATSAVRVKLGVAGVTAGAGDMLVQPADAVIVRTIGLTHVSAVTVSGNAVVQISPLDV